MAAEVVIHPDDAAAAGLSSDQALIVVASTVS